MPTSATLAFAKLLDLALVKAFDQGYELVKDTASAPLHSAAKDLQKEQSGREQRLAAIVQKAAELALPGLRELEAQPDWPYATILEHRQFLNAVVEQLLVGGQPDPQQLRRYVEETVGPEAWRQMGEPLLRFVDEIERQLRQDSLWAGPLSAFRIAWLMEGLPVKLLRIAEATEEAAATLRTLPTDLAAALAHRQGLPDLEALERVYLSGLYSECNKLPLADEAPPDVPQERRPRLQRVYVDLRVEAEPTLARICDRLGLPAARRRQLERALSQALAGETQPGRGKDKLPDELAPRLREEIAPGLLRQAAAGRENEKLNQALKDAGVTPDAFAAALGKVTVFEQMAEHRQLVLLGDPGSGKSTLTRRLAGMLAAAADPALPPEEAGWQAALAPACAHWLLPVRVTLSRWASQPPPADPGAASDLIAECLRLIHQTAPSLPAGRFLDRLSSQPATVLLLLDGLDEVSDIGQRKRLLAAVRAFCQSYSHVPLLVTCRVRPYQEGEAFHLPLPEVRLAPLDDGAVAAFLDRWHDELVWVGTYDADAAGIAQHRLQEAIADPERKELAEMAGTPLLLTMMARVNYKRGLPGSRAKLYEEYVKELLWEWEKKKQDDPGQASDLERLLRQAGVDPISLNLALDRLAYQVHGQTGSRDSVDIPDMQVRKAIEAIHPGDAEAKATWAVQVLRLMDARSGLLYARKEQEVYAFAHRTFQEYLAARHLATGDFRAKFKLKIDDPNWREAVLLGLGYLVFQEPGRFDDVLSVLHALLPDTPQTEADWRRVLLLGEAYARLLTPQRAGEAEDAKMVAWALDAFPARLTAALQRPTPLARQRLEAGLLLADLDHAPPDLDDFVPIPGANFAIGRYPVTNKQYKRFMDAGGYAKENEKRWWSEDGRKYKHQYNWTEPRYWDDSRFNRPTQPVIGVSWYEANAYCAWLTEELRIANFGLRSGGFVSQSAIPNPPFQARLPSEAEWRQAAGKETYPWGPTFAAANANTEESGLNQTTPVHMYPAGQTKDGVWDMAGNVWEWTADRYENVNAYWLLGGAYWNNKDNVGAAARDWRDPFDWNDFIGFRVLVSPISR